MVSCLADTNNIITLTLMHLLSPEFLQSLSNRYSVHSTYTWVHKCTHGYIRVHMDTYGYTQLHTDTYRYIRVHVVICGYTLVHTGTHSYGWIHMGTYGYAWYTQVNTDIQRYAQGYI